MAPLGGMKGEDKFRQVCRSLRVKNKNCNWFQSNEQGEHQLRNLGKPGDHKPRPKNPREKTRSRE